MCADAVSSKTLQSKTKGQAKPDSSASSKKISKIASKVCATDGASLSTSVAEVQQPVSDIVEHRNLPKENAQCKDRVNCSKASGQKKRNRRNQERVSSATTLDFRIASNVAAGDGSSERAISEKENKVCVGSKDVLLKSLPESVCNKKANDNLCSTTASEKCSLQASNGLNSRLGKVAGNRKTSQFNKDKPSTGL